MGFAEIFCQNALKVSAESFEADLEVRAVGAGTWRWIFHELFSCKNDVRWSGMKEHCRSL